MNESLETVNTSACETSGSRVYFNECLRFPYPGHSSFFILLLLEEGIRQEFVVTIRRAKPRRNNISKDAEARALRDLRNNDEIEIL